jgi:hypothetical protein
MRLASALGEHAADDAPHHVPYLALGRHRPEV